MFVENKINSTKWGENALRNLGGVLIEFFFTFSFVICCFLANSGALRFSLTR
jgi:hypothetical protein